MSGFRERREERHEGRRERHERGREDEYDNYGSQGHRHREEDGYGYEGEQRHPQSFQTRGQEEGRGYGYAPPTGPPPSSGRGGSGFALQGGLDRGDFASDDDINRLIASGELGGGQGGRQGHGYSGEGGERGNAYGRYDPPSGPPAGQGYGERTHEHGRYDAPTGPPPQGRGNQTQQPHQQGYGSGGAHGPGYGSESQYGSQQSQGRSWHEPPQGPPSGAGYGREQGNAPSGGFSASRDGEEHYGSGHGAPPSNDRSGSRPGGATSYQGQGDYTHLADIAHEHGDDPELYRRATQGLQDRIQSQAQSRRPGRDDDYNAHVDAHRKAYGGDDHGPMDADAIGAAAAMEAFKQTAATAGTSGAPAGAFKATGGAPSKSGRAAQDDDEEEETATRAGPSGGGGLQDKLMALAMSQAGKLFDKKNAGSSGSSASTGNASQEKAQAMQSAAATAMQLFTQYQSKGKIDSSDMSQVMQLAMKML